MMQPEQPNWKTIDATGFKPDYMDASGKELRFYGASIQVDDKPEGFALLPDARPLQFIKYFATIFLPMFVVVAYSLIPGPEKWLFVIGGPIVGGFAFSLMYFFVSQEIKNGPYFEFNPVNGVVRLPRYNAEFKIGEIECLQWITGGSKNRGMDRSTDLNLIVRTNDGDKRRYFLIGSPKRKIAIAISEKIRIPVTEITLGLQGKRDIDAGTST